MEYCSTIPPLQQLAGALPPPPTVMVPVGVLKREGSTKPRSEGPKSVMFSDGKLYDRRNNLFYSTHFYYTEWYCDVKSNHSRHAQHSYILTLLSCFLSLFNIPMKTRLTFISPTSEQAIRTLRDPSFPNPVCFVFTRISQKRYRNKAWL